jgi:two-component system LytT family response regulator
MRCVIVDDEPLARQIVREYLGDFPSIEVSAECGNGKQAVRTINQKKPELVFLDIRMPGMDGFEVLERLTYLPSVIFSTAYSDFALKAFEVNAIDYLLKPYDRKRFAKAVQRVVQRGRPRAEEFNRLLGLLQDARGHSGHPDRFFVRLGRRLLSVRTSEIQWIKADGDYSKLHTPKEEFFCNLSLNALEQQLDPGRFIRVHRSSIVAKDAIQTLSGDGEGGFIASLTNNVKVRVSRTYAGKIKALIW